MHGKGTLGVDFTIDTYSYAETRGISNFYKTNNCFSITINNLNGNLLPYVGDEQHRMNVPYLVYDNLNIVSFEHKNKLMKIKLWLL